MREIFGKNPFFLALVVGAMFFYITFKNAPKFLEWLRWQSIGTRDYIVERLALMFIEVSPNQVLGGMLASSLVPGFLIFFLMLPQFIPASIFGAIIALVCWFIPKLVVDNMFEKRVMQFNYQMIDGLGLMANGMKSGLSIIQAMGLVMKEMPNPMSQEMDYVLKQNLLGVSVEDAFQNLAKRIPSEDVNMFVTSVVILKETGGNLAETFETIVYTIRERLKVQQKISAMMAQNLTQGVIIFSMPFAMIAMFYFTDPEFLMPMFTDVIGYIILAIAFTLQMIGGFLILKFTKIKV